MINKIFLFVIVIFFAGNVFAQNGQIPPVIIVNQGPNSNTPLTGNEPREVVQERYSGKVFRVTNNEDAAGSPFLFDHWMPGIVFSYNGSRFDNIDLKYDVLHDKFLFSRNDTTFELQDDVTEVILKDTTGMDGALDFKKIISIDNKSQPTFVQVLSSGKVPLYKQYNKSIEGENFTNGLVTTEKKIVAHNSYWTIRDNETVPVKINSHSLDELTSDKEAEMQNFLKSNKVNPKKERGFASALDYYNSISAPAKDKK